MSNWLSRTSLLVWTLLYNATFATYADLSTIEIYRIVSSKALDSGEGAQATIGAGQNISLSKPADDEASKGGKCC
jgi:Ras-related protein Rab-11A